MGLRLLIVFIFAGLLCFVLAANVKEELKAVVVLFRHGARSPLSSWPNDIYFGNSSLWPDGYGQLNNKGKERHYLLGQWFRERYDGFLPRRYNRSDIYVKSTDVDRTLMSAASNLAGLYPPQGDQVWNSHIPWQAIPIHTVPEAQDPILTGEVPCPKHERLLEQLLNSTEFQQINEQLADLYKNISEVAGYSTVNIYTFSGIFSTATIYKEYNLPLPGWIETYWPQIVEYSAKKFQFDTYTRELARLRVGPFFDYLFGYFENVTNGVLVPVEHIRGPSHQTSAIKDGVPPKFLMLSAHDGTIGDRTNAMGVYPDATPEFASTVIWELKSDGKGDYINMFFKNSTSFSNLTLPGCSFDCSLDEYKKLLLPITATVKEWQQECNE